MPINKIPNSYVNNNAAWVPLRTVAIKVNEVIDEVNDIIDGEGTETFENITVTDTTTTDTLVVGDEATISVLTVDNEITTNDLTFTGNITGPQIVTDQITEQTGAAGVTIDSALIKDGTIALVDGLVSDLSIKLGADTNNGIYGVSDTQLGFAVEGTLVGGFNTTGLFTDVISEQTSTVGVTVDGVLLKDGGVSANSMFAGFYPIGAEQALSGPGAINLTSYNTKFTSTGTGDALTLADGSQIGQKKKVMYVAEGAGGDTGVLTLTGYTSITFNAINDYVILIWNGAAWFALESVGVTIV